MARIVLNNEDLKTVNEAADLIGVQPVTIWRKIRSGKIISVWIGNNRYIPIDEVNRVLAERAESVTNRPSGE